MANPIEPMQWLSMVASFVLVLGLLGATLWVLRRMGGRSIRGAGGRLALQESLWLGPRQRVALIRVDDQEILIAITQQQVTMLTRLPLVDAPDNDLSLGASDRGPQRPAAADTLSVSSDPEPNSPQAARERAALSDRFRTLLGAWSSSGSRGRQP
jgi:flagellar protein FliO/FliZ